VLLALALILGLLLTLTLTLALTLLLLLSSLRLRCNLRLRGLWLGSLHLRLLMSGCLWLSLWLLRGLSLFRSNGLCLLLPLLLL